MAIGWGAAIAGAGDIIGGLFGQNNTAATNAMNMQITQQSEKWMEQMSDSAMQRRVADLKAAGLNPMLAVGQGGASTPGVSPIPMQSSNALGQGISAAAGTAAQVANMNADTQKKQAEANLTRSQTPSQTPLLDENGDPDFTRSGGGTLGNLTAQQAQQQIKVGQAAVQQLKAAANQSDSQAALNDAQRALTNVSADQARQIQQWAVAKAKADAGIAENMSLTTGAEAKIMGTKWGPVIYAANKVLGGPVGTALQMFTKPFTATH